MAVPVKKVSIAKKHTRTSTWRTLKIKKLMKKLVLVKCQCGEYVRKHHVCPNCGVYRGKQVIIPKQEKIIEA